jgi:uncharacterized protein YndB with AHSA1/START domain
VTTDVLEVTVHMAAQPDTIFPFFTDPVRYAQWMGTDVELEAKPGGLYRVRMREGVEVSGAFEEVEPPHRLVFTWGWDGDPAVPPGSTRVEVTLTAESGGTRVTLRHHGLPTAEQVEHHTMGWEMYLGRLNLVLQGADPGSDPNSG